MTCSICSAPATVNDLCACCASRIQRVAPATLSDLKAASRRRYWLDRAMEGDTRAHARCVRKGWIAPVGEMSAENRAERRSEVFGAARLSGATVEEAWRDVEALD
jgi:hypothetical protein